VASSFETLLSYASPYDKTGMQPSSSTTPLESVAFLRRKFQHDVEKITNVNLKIIALVLCKKSGETEILVARFSNRAPS
jgi:hypothetical protein